MDTQFAQGADFTASATAIADAWEEIQFGDWTVDNFSQDVAWNVTDTTYINGCECFIDRDIEAAYLLEICERTSRARSYLAIIYKMIGKREVSWYEGYVPSWGEETDGSNSYVVMRWFVDLVELALQEEVPA